MHVPAHKQQLRYITFLLIIMTEKLVSCTTCITTQQELILLMTPYLRRKFGEHVFVQVEIVEVCQTANARGKLLPIKTTEGQLTGSPPHT